MAPVWLLSWESIDHSVYILLRSGWMASSLENKCLNAVHDRPPTLKHCLSERIISIDCSVAMYVCMSVDWYVWYSAVVIPVQPDWLFSRPSLTMDFLTDTSSSSSSSIPQDPVSSFHITCFALFAFSGLCLVHVFSVFLICLLSYIFQREPTWMALYSLIVLMCH